MIIAKEFTFEAAHIVRNAVSRRCKYNIHGHSYKVELSISGDLDESGMVIDFGLLYPFKEVVDAFDHSFILWNEDKEVKDFIWKINERIVEMPVNTTAENLATLFFQVASRILRVAKVNAFVEFVKVWETAKSQAIAIEEGKIIYPEVKFKANEPRVWQNILTGKEIKLPEEL